MKYWIIFCNAVPLSDSYKCASSGFKVLKESCERRLIELFHLFCLEMKTL